VGEGEERGSGRGRGEREREKEEKGRGREEGGKKEEMEGEEGTFSHNILHATMQ